MRSSKTLTAKQVAREGSHCEQRRSQTKQVGPVAVIAAARPAGPPEVEFSITPTTKAPTTNHPANRQGYLCLVEGVNGPRYILIPPGCVTAIAGSGVPVEALCEAVRAACREAEDRATLTLS